MCIRDRDKQFCIFAGQTHVTPLGLNRHRFWHTMEAFLTLPDRLDQDMADG